MDRRASLSQPGWRTRQIFRETLEVAMKMRSVIIHITSEYFKHASDRCFIDRSWYCSIYIVLQSMQIIHIYINIYYYIHNYIWYMYMIVCKCSFSIPSDHWQDQSSIGAMLAFLRVTQRSSRTLERMPERVATRYLNQARGAMAWQEDFEIFCTGGTLASCVCGHFCCVMILQNFPCISCIVVMQCSLLTIAKLPGGSDSL